MIHMNALVVYDSAYGNTEKIAKAIGEAIGGQVKILRSSEATSSLAGVDLLIAGAPTYGGRPTPAMLEFLDKIPANCLKGVRTAAFDTRLTSRFAAVFGYAAGKIGAGLDARGGTQIVPPEGFLVKGKKGPLVDGETERASAWGKTISQRYESAGQG